MLVKPPQRRLETLISALPDRQRQVLQVRYGLQGRTPLSLRQVGKRMGISGERVRHIERDAIISLLRDREVVRWATQPLVGALAEAGGIARFEELVKALQRKAPPDNQPSEGVVRLLRRLDERVVRVRTGRGEVWALRDCPIAQVPAIEALCISVLRESRAGLSIECLGDILLERAPSPKPDRAFVTGVIRICPGVAIEDGWCFYGRARHKLVQLVEVLRQAETPLHVRVIKERLNQRLNEPSTSHAVHEFLSRERDVFVRVGPGIFDLKERCSKA